MKRIVVKRLTSLFMSAVIICLSFVCAFSFEVKDFEDFHSNVAFLVSVEYGEVIYEKNADLRTSPSSLVKIATAIKAIDYYGEEGLDTVVTASWSAIDSVPFGTIASGLKSGENLTVRQLLYYILVQSANDAAHVLAYQIGSENKREGRDEIGSFVDMLNEFAASLGCVDTYFYDSTGIDDSNNYTTARDIAKIASYAYKNGTFREIASTVAYTMPATNMNTSRTLTTNNSLIVWSSEYYYDLANGMKTGASDKDRCLVGTTENNGRSFIAVVMESEFETVENGEETDYVNYSFIDAKKMLKWANENLIYKTVVDENSITGIEVKVENGAGVDYVMLRPDRKITMLVPNNFELKYVTFEVKSGELPEKLNATVNEGDEVCSAAVLYKGQPLGEVKLVCSKTVNKNVFLALGSALANVFGITAVRIIVFLVIILLIAIMARMSINKKNKRKIKVVDKNDGKKEQ